MPLAAILGVCVLLALSPAAGHAPVRARVVFQETQPQQDSPQPDSSQEPAKPTEPDTRPDQTPTPPAQAPATDSAQQPQSSPLDTSAKKSDSKTTASPGTKSKKSHKSKPAPQSGAGPAKVVVRNGSTADPPVQLSPTLTQQQASSQLQNINKLLATTDANLKKISGRQLSPTQQDMVNQVRKYMEQARAAIASGDLQRARNLAFKARLLSDDLLKQ
jgi:hypothetical protein